MSNHLDIEDISSFDDDDLLKLMEDDIDFDKNKEDLDKFDNIRICIQCETPDHLIEDIKAGIVVCKKCGMVVDTIMDHGPEWHGDDSRTSSRFGLPTNPHLPKSSMTTEIAGHPMDRFKRVHGWDNMPYDERSIYIVFKLIKEYCQKAKLPGCVEQDAKIMYRHLCEYRKKNEKKIIVRGANRQALIWTCIYFACKKEGYVRSPKEIASLSGLKYKDITKGFKIFTKLIRSHKSQKIKVKFDSILPEDFVPRFCKELKISEEFTNDTLKMTRNIGKLNIASKHNPLSIAVGTILLMVEMNDIDISKKNINKQFGVSEVTIAKAYKEIYPYRNIITDNSKTEIIVQKLEEKRRNSVLPEAFRKRVKELNL